MGRNADETNTLVFEYDGPNETTATAFEQLVDTIAETSPTVTGFRLELTTDDTLDVPFEIVIDEQSDSAAARHNPTDTEGDAGDSSNTTESNGTPSLQSDGLPAKVLSCMLDSEEDAIRTRDLQQEFEDDDIDTTRISQTLASLRRRDLVAAEPDPEDNRANIYWPTDQAPQALGD